MTHSVDYYAVAISPWTYLGHERFCAIARAAGATVNLKMMDLGAVFVQSGGLPLKQRAPQRQAYRLQELARWSAHLNIPMNVQPKYFPADTSLASAVTVHLRDTVSTDAALRFLGSVTKAVWADELNIAERSTVEKLLVQQGYSAALIDLSQNNATADAIKADTDAALQAQVFGAPSFVIGDQLYWGQDRLDFVKQALS